MHKRLFRVMTVVVCVCSFPLLGCDRRQIEDIMVGGVKSTVVEVSAFVVESFIDDAFGLE